ncbi:hypothetical protein Hanom_Chr07g00611461 [Helianthus anomalus]
MTNQCTWRVIKENGRMATVPKRADEELWYLQIVRNFSLPRDEDLDAQPSTGAGELTNLGIGPEKKKQRVPAVIIAPKKTSRPKAQFSKAKSVKGEKKGLAPVVVKRPKAEPQDTADIPTSNPDDPIELESSPEPLAKMKAVKRKKVEVEAEAQPAKKVPKRKIGKRGNIDAFITKPPPVSIFFICYLCALYVNITFVLAEKPIPSACAEPSSIFNDNFPPSSPRACIREQLEGTKVVETEVEKVVEVENPKVEKPVEVEMETEKVVEPETADVDVARPKSPEVVARDPEKGNSAHEDLGSFAHDEENSPIRPEETPGDYYYRTYSEKKAYEIHAPLWKLKKGNTFSDWRVCRDWLQGTFPPAEVKFQEDRSHGQSYHAYLEEAASFTSTTHRIVREWRSMYKEWSTVEASKKKASEEEA